MEWGCKTQSCRQYEIDQKRTSTQSVAQLMINDFFCLCSLEADPTGNILVQTTAARQSDSYEASATGKLVTSGPEYPNVYFDGKAASTLSDNKKMSLLEGKWESSDLHKYTFPSRHTFTAYCTIDVLDVVSSTIHG